jgi:hypothetical protein
MAKVIVVGGGFAGCSAAMAAAKTGAKVTLFERTDLLLGCGLRAGLMDQNGRITAYLEMKALGGADILETLRSVMIHPEIDIPTTENGYAYDVGLSEPAVRKLLVDHGVDVRMESRVDRVIQSEKDAIEAVAISGGEPEKADAFVDASGTFGTIEQCSTYGPGCVMCILRCPTYGNRYSIATAAGAPELVRKRVIDGVEYVGGTIASVCMYKNTLSSEIREELAKKGWIHVPIPPEFINYRNLATKASTAFDSKQLAENVILVDIGVVAKAFHLTYFPQERLRKIPGFEKAVIEHTQNPISHGRASFVRYLSMTTRDNTLRVSGFKNLFCAGEKSGPLHGVCDVTLTGYVAGYEAARVAFGMEPIEFPRASVVGDFLAFIGERTSAPKGLERSYSLGGGQYFKQIKQLGLYSHDEAEVRERIQRLGLTDIFAKPLN